MKTCVCPCDYMESNNRKKPLREIIVASVLCLMSSEEGKIIDYRFYHDERVFIYIYIYVNHLCDA